MRLPRHLLAVEDIELEVISKWSCCQVAQHKHDAVESRVETHLEKVFDGNLLNEVETVFSEDPMVD